MIWPSDDQRLGFLQFAGKTYEKFQLFRFYLYCMKEPRKFLYGLE